MNDILTLKGPISMVAKSASTDYRYGPWLSLSEAHKSLSNYGQNVIGLTIALKNASGAIVGEYWYKDGNGLENLVPKNTTSSGNSSGNNSGSGNTNPDGPSKVYTFYTEGTDWSKLSATNTIIEGTSSFKANADFEGGITSADIKVNGKDVATVDQLPNLDDFLKKEDVAQNTFDTLVSANNYVQQLPKADAQGLIVSVINDTKYKNGVYYTNNTGKQLLRVGPINDIQLSFEIDENNYLCMNTEAVTTEQIGTFSLDENGFLIAQLK